MTDIPTKCILCEGVAGDAALQRVQAWEDQHWRLTISLAAEVLGFSYLEPKRHIPHITDLDGEEAGTLGHVLSRVTRALRDETGADVVYVYVFGDGVPHLHFHLAPHRAGDALSDQMIKGELEIERLDSGAGRLVSKAFPVLPERGQRQVAQRVGDTLSSLEA